MTDIRGYQTYQALLEQLDASITRATRRVTEAQAAGDEALAQSIDDIRGHLIARSFAMRAAQRATLTADAPTGATPVAQLRQILVSGSQSLARLESLASALKGASEFLNLVTRLIALA